VSTYIFCGRPPDVRPFELKIGTLVTSYSYPEKRSQQFRFFGLQDRQTDERTDEHDL